jgi:hypothetical protein
MIALLNGYRHLGDERYLEDAALIGNWIHNHWHDSENGGYEMGLGSGGVLEPWPGQIKSTEHNIDVFSAFSLLADAREELGQQAEADVWRARAEDAGQFVISMARQPDGGFWTGTETDGLTPNDEVAVLDPQSWSVLAFAPRDAWQGTGDWEGALAYAQSELGTTDAMGDGTVKGFDFGKDLGESGEPDGVWLEGTAQMAAAYGTMGMWAPAEHYLRQLREAQSEHPAGDGAGLVAASVDGLTTGFGGVYDGRLHVGATAWAMVANESYNPLTASWTDQPRGSDRLGMAMPSWWHDKYEGWPAREALTALTETGAEIVEITPSWYQDNIHSNVLDADPLKTPTDAGVRSIIQSAHDGGMEVLLKPHVELWSGESRTELSPENPGDWFDSYTDFVMHYADIAEETGAEYFSVGTELSSMTGATHLSEWEDLIGLVSDIYGGETVYSANHDEYMDVAFWDDLDMIGLDAYFDLGTAVPHASPGAEELRHAWEPVMDDLAGWLTENHPEQSILVTEIGYRNIDDAHIRPWEAWRDGTPDEATQAACYEAALDAWGERPWVEGMIFWTWPNNLDEDIPQNKPDTGYVPYGRMAEDVFAAATEPHDGFARLATHAYLNEGVRVSVYDTDPANGVSSPDVAWSWSDFRWGLTDVVVDAGWSGDGVIDQIMLFGEGSESRDLGIVVEGNSSLGSVIDNRVSPTPLGFVASEGTVSYVSAPAGLGGADLNGWMTEGEWTFPADLDADGVTDDPVALFTPGDLWTVIALETIAGDVVAGGAAGYLQANGEGLQADLKVGGRLNMLHVPEGDVRGGVDAADIGQVLAGAGSIFDGQIRADGRIDSVMAIGGDIVSDVISETDRIGMVMAQATWDPGGNSWRGGSVGGQIEAASGVDSVFAYGGDLTGSVNSGSGILGTVMATANYDWIAGEQVGGLLSGDLTSGADMWYVQSRDCAGTLSVGGILGSIVVQRDMDGAGVELAGGTLYSISVMRNVDTSSIRLGNGAGGLAGRLENVYVGGDVRNTDIEAGSLGSMYVSRWADNTRLRTAGNMGSVVLGAVRDSTCFAGVRTTRDVNEDGVLDLPDPATDLELEPSARASIGSLQIVGLPGVDDCNINSNLAAAEIGFVYEVESRDDNGGVPFGTAADYIGMYVWEDEGAFEVYYGMNGPGDSRVWQDAEIRLV